MLTHLIRRAQRLQRYCHSHAPRALEPWQFEGAARDGNWPAMMRAIRACTQPGILNHYMYHAAVHGYADVAKAAFSQGAPTIEWALLGAARGGSSSLADWAIAHGACNLNAALSAAAEMGHIHIVMAMVGRGAGDIHSALDAARRQPLIFRFLHKLMRADQP